MSSWPQTSEQDPVSPSVSLSHQEAFISFLSFSIREGRQTENHNHRKLTNLVTWTTALSNSVKLWAMPCRATQGGQVMVESSDKMWSTGEGNGKPFQYSCLEKPMNSILTIQSSNHAVWYLTCQWQIGTCQGHLPSVSVEIESCAAAAVDFDKAWRKFRVENEALCSPSKLMKHVFR